MLHDDNSNFETDIFPLPNSFDCQTTRTFIIPAIRKAGGNHILVYYHNR